MKLIVGLGNPGREYENTRHNIGFMVVDNYLGNVNWSKKFNGEYYETSINGEKVIFLKPLTFMNNSGAAVGEVVKYYDIALRDILVIQDDLDEEMGTYKLKVKSSSGGHNGIKSIINNLHSEEFPRLKIGISNEYEDNVIDFVLGKFSKKDLNKIAENLPKFCNIIDSFINYGIDKTMNVYNTK